VILTYGLPGEARQSSQPLHFATSNHSGAAVALEVVRAPPRRLTRDKFAPTTREAVNAGFLPGILRPWVP